MVFIKASYAFLRVGMAGLQPDHCAYIPLNGTFWVSHI